MAQIGEHYMEDERVHTLDKFFRGFLHACLLPLRQ